MFTETLISFSLGNNLHTSVSDMVNRPMSKLKSAGAKKGHYNKFIL